MSTSSGPSRIFVGMIIVAACCSLVLAGSTVNPGTYRVYDQGGTNIGTASSSNGGATIGYVDNPATSHPPDTGAVYTDPDGDGTYEDANGPFTVVFTALLGGGYIWKKYNAQGGVVDCGTMQPTIPHIRPL